jgi:hypothetical protein
MRIIPHFGFVIAIPNSVLKITVVEKAELVTLKLDGQIAGPWMAEFNRAWLLLAPSLDSKRLSLDLRGVTHINVEGQHLLAEIYDKTGAEFQTDSLVMEFYAQEAMQARDRHEKQGA